jgi:hypothetical protein
MTDTKDENDAFDAIFKSDNDVAEVTTPEFVAEKAKPKMDKTNQIFKYGKYALVLLVLMLVILFIIALALPSDNPSQTAQAPDIRIASQDVSRSTDKAPEIEEPYEKDISSRSDNAGVVLENTELQEALQLARKNTEYRDLKYKELLNKYILLLEENERLKNGISKKTPPMPVSRGLKTITGVSVYSIYNGYAFIKKGQTVYTVTLGETVAGGKVTAIDAINREVITTKGVIR